MKKLDIPALLTALVMLVSAGTGLFYSFGGGSYEITAHHGQTVTIFGDGIYKNDTLMKAATTKGTDAAMILVSAALIICVLCERKIRGGQLLKTGLLCGIFYDSVCLSMGTVMNRLFPLYTVIFSLSFFSVIINMKKCFDENLFNQPGGKRKTGLALFVGLGGCSVLCWLMFIIPAVVSGDPYASVDTLEIYASEPTFALDLGIVFPACIICCVGLIRGKSFARPLACVLMTVLTCVAVTVLGQTAVQMMLGIFVEPGKLVVLVGVFVALGAAALVLNIRLLKEANPPVEIIDSNI